MKKIAKAIRYITVAPVCAILLNVSLFFLVPETFNNIYELLVIISVLGLIPTLAYPIQRKFKVLKGDSRESERKLAIIFSILGYIIGALISTFASIPYLQKVIYLTYFFSGIFMVIFNFIFRIKASGHMCGFVGPMALIVYYLNDIGFISLIVLGLIIWSSLYLKRHKWSELMIGSFLPIAAMFVSIFIIM